MTSSPPCIQNLHSRTVLLTSIAVSQKSAFFQHPCASIGALFHRAKVEIQEDRTCDIRSQPFAALQHLTFQDMEHARR